jgi:hypothetical protein
VYIVLLLSAMTVGLRNAESGSRKVRRGTGGGHWWGRRAAEEILHVFAIPEPARSAKDKGLVPDG